MTLTRASPGTSTPLPETVRAKQHRVHVFLEFFQHGGARRAGALHKEFNLRASQKIIAFSSRDLLHELVAGEEHKCLAMRLLDEMLQSNVPARPYATRVRAGRAFSGRRTISSAVRNRRACRLTTAWPIRSRRVSQSNSGRASRLPAPTAYVSRRKFRCPP